MAAAKSTTRIIAEFKGHSGTRRVLTVADQNRIVGAAVATKELAWEPGLKSKLDVTEAPADVIEYLKGDPKFALAEVEVPASDS